ncbi:hypothetical protein WJX82_003096 [Trebouxia sp. C0006]
MPGIDVSEQLSMSLDEIISEATREPRIEKRPSQDRRPRGQLFNLPRGIVKSRSTARSEDRRPKDFATQEFIKVSLNSDPKVVAGKIAHCSRSDCPPTVLAIGQGCLNQAIKAVAIARRFCMQPQTHNDMAFDLSCQPAFRENSAPARSTRDAPPSKPSLALYLAKRKPNTHSSSKPKMEMPVASATDPSIVAGALAARVREGAEVYLTAIGVDAVGNAMRAICFARLYLEDDDLDIKAMPEFVHLMKDGTQMSGMQFNIIVESAI